MPDRPLLILKLDSILQRCGDERRPHHMGRVAMAQFELVDVLLQHDVNALFHACTAPTPPQVCDGPAGVLPWK
jgi:hypothetical protein